MSAATQPRAGHVVVQFPDGKTCGHKHPTVKSATSCRRVRLMGCEKGSEPTLRFVPVPA